MTHGPPLQEERLPALDGVRGIAILLVLFHNLLVLRDPQGVVEKLAGWALDRGWVGVQLFFVLSGFLITRILLVHQDSPRYYRSFFARRVLRTWPLYYLTLLALWLVPWALQGHAEPAAGTLWAWLLVSNWTMPLGWGDAGAPHFWSLAVEEQFYLFWPFLVHRRTARQVAWLCVGLMVASPLIRWALLSQGVGTDAIYQWTPCRMDALAGGGAVAAFCHLRQQQVQAPLSRAPAWPWASALLVLLAGLAITRGYSRVTPLGQTLGYSALALGMSLWLLSITWPGANPVFGGRWLRSTSLARFGRYSFGMYVLHKPLHDLLGMPLLKRLTGSSALALPGALGYLALGVLVTLLAGAMTHHLIERPFLSLKSRARW